MPSENILLWRNLSSRKMIIIIIIKVIIIIIIIIMIMIITMMIIATITILMMILIDNNFYGKSNILLRTFSSCSYAVKLQLFMSYCGSMYTAFLWCDFTKRKYRQLEVAYNNVFRKLMGYYKYCRASGMFVENRTDAFDACVRKLAYGFRERLDISDNPLIETVINNSARRSSKLLLLWEDYLYWP